MSCRMCSLVEINQRFRSDLMMKGVRTSKTEVAFNQTTWP
jgi:hypothetical protein